MLKKLDIVVMLVKDWPVAVQWYTEKLGLKIVYKENDHQWCQLSFEEPGGTTLALYGVEDLDLGVKNRCVPDILVDDLDKTVVTLKKRGVRFRGDIRNGDEGYRITTFYDLEGNELQLYEWV